MQVDVCVPCGRQQLIKFKREILLPLGRRQSTVPAFQEYLCIRKLGVENVHIYCARKINKLLMVKNL